MSRSGPRTSQFTWKPVSSISLTPSPSYLSYHRSNWRVTQVPSKKGPPGGSFTSSWEAILHGPELKDRSETLKSPSKPLKEGPFTMYCEVVNYLLETYATNNPIDETTEKIMRFTQPLNNTPIEYNELLWSKALRYNLVYHEYVLNGNFTEALEDCIFHSMLSFWGLSKHWTG